tara:strand:+ start:576 stop:1802 length:1227 start_codon:yes stop_codon:yes gene_type:complete
MRALDHRAGLTAARKPTCRVQLVDAYMKSIKTKSAPSKKDEPKTAMRSEPLPSRKRKADDEDDEEEPAPKKGKVKIDVSKLAELVKAAVGPKSAAKAKAAAKAPKEKKEKKKKGNDTVEVEKICGMRAGATGLEYRIKWKGEKDTTWESYDNVMDDDLVDDFEEELQVMMPLSSPQTTPAARASCPLLCPDRSRRACFMPSALRTAPAACFCPSPPSPQTTAAATCFCLWPPSSMPHSARCDTPAISHPFPGGVLRAPHGGVPPSSLLRLQTKTFGSVDLDVGAKVEVRSVDEGFQNSWSEATVTAKKGKKYTVDYDKFVDAKGKKLSDSVDRTRLRPTQRGAPSGWAPQLYEVIEVSDDDCWWEAGVESLKGNKATVKFRVSDEVKTITLGAKVRPCAWLKMAKSNM